MNTDEMKDPSHGSKKADMLSKAEGSKKQSNIDPVELVIYSYHSQDGGKLGGRLLRNTQRQAREARSVEAMRK